MVNFRDETSSGSPNPSYGTNPFPTVNEPQVTHQQPGSVKRKYNNDPLVIHPVDHPGLTLTTAVLTRETYFGWCLSIQLALPAKIKIGFIDGTFPRPIDQEDGRQWGIVDSMVRAWIMNTIDIRLQRRFQSTKTSRDLWLEVKSRYEGNNGPRRYYLQKDIVILQQGRNDLEEYYSKVRLLWDEMFSLKPVRRCRCGGTKTDCDGCFLETEMLQDDEENKLLQFLMGLNDHYDYVKDQILMQESWPAVYKAFTMLQNVEKNNYSRSVQQDSSMYVREGNDRRNYLDKSKSKNSICNHCGGKGHLKEKLFQTSRLPGLVETTKRKTE
ncbi:uncharacterized protein LOC124943840 [Impatiens glandulifera]|uniref:uncharacterized protein LOC124943840 n=1 Tax=Impatiens glandulifera TaxID=253017 RepID=UPI001FB110F7|nr:uncharacterized protein LOC124943840 [Impatiens glandulifera]